MPAIQAPATVLVTGANGFIAVFLIRVLLEQGYTVRGTVRSFSRSLAHLQSIFSEYIDVPGVEGQVKDGKEGRLEIIEVTDFTVDDVFEEAVKGVDAIVHAASPAHKLADDPDELIVPAVLGTEGILKTALKHAPQLKRFIYISSDSTLFAPQDPHRPAHITEALWNEYSVKRVRELRNGADQLDKYRASKYLAEKAFWKFISAHPLLPWDAISILPTLTIGPLLQQCTTLKEINASNGLLLQNVNVLLGLDPGATAKWSYGFVDVRDVAEGIVKALQIPEAGGERILLSAYNASTQEWWDIINALGIPGISAPVGEPGLGIGREAREYRFILDGSKAQALLGIQYREDKSQTMRDLLEDLRGKGLL